MTLREPHLLLRDDGLVAEDKELINDINASLERLSHIRAVEITASGPFAKSKIAWKLATYQYGLLHRVVALMDGIAVAWNNCCTLSAMLSARALMETIAVMAELERCILSFLAKEDLAQLDTLAQKGLFASRDEEWLLQHSDTKAKNAVSYIDQFDKQAEGFRHQYNALSERCHPNALGHNLMFSELDLSDGTVRFCYERHPDRNEQLILAALAPLPLIESIMARLDDAILKVSDLQHRLSPRVGY